MPSTSLAMHWKKSFLHRLNNQCVMYYRLNYPHGIILSVSYLVHIRHLDTPARCVMYRRGHFPTRKSAS